MIVDTLHNASKYFSVHPLFAKAFEYIEQTDLDECSRWQIGYCRRIESYFFQQNRDDSRNIVAKFECHNYHIDIQLCIKGVETIGWKPREKCVDRERRL